MENGNVLTIGSEKESDSVIPSASNVEIKHEQENGSEELKQDVNAIVEQEMIDLEEKRRRECFGNMEKIEKEFADLKEKFFNEKIDALRKEYETIKNGTHQGFVKKCKELEELRQHKLWAAERWKEYQFQNLENMFEAEKIQAEDEFEADRKSLREKMMTIAVEKRRKLTEEKSSLSLIDPGITLSPRVSLRKRSNSKDSKEPTYKRKLNPPHIAYALQESEIVEDLNLIQKGMSNNSAISTKYTTTATVVTSRSSLATTSDVYTDKGKLHYHNQVFDKGKDVFIEAKQENGKWQGTIVVVNPAEIHIKSSDGTKSRFSLAQLRNGKYTLTAVN